MPPPGRTALAAACAACGAALLVLSPPSARAFLPPTRVAPRARLVPNAATTALSMAKRKKLSMKERRKMRAKRQPAANVDRGIMDDLPPVDSWDKTEPTTAVAPTEGSAGDGDVVDDDGAEEKARASSLVEAQRKSVDALSFVRKRVEEAFPIADAAKAIAERGYFVHDDFLCSGDDGAFGDALLSEMFDEGSAMLAEDKLERDIARLGDGEFLGSIVGGEKYADCPRLTEYVVSLTRHLPPLLNKETDALATSDVSRLDATASMGTIRLYDRKTRLGAATLLADPSGGGDVERPFETVCGDGDGSVSDSRRLTAMLFLSTKEWDPLTCGGGVTFEKGEGSGALRDRMVLLCSDSCSHRMEPWTGADKAGLERAGCVIVHFVKDSTSGS